jgi:hypothetical protein
MPGLAVEPYWQARLLDAQVTFPSAFQRPATVAADRRENTPEQIDETPRNAICGSVADRARLTIGSNAEAKAGSILHGLSISIKNASASE